MRSPCCIVLRGPYDTARANLTVLLFFSASLLHELLDGAQGSIDLPEYSQLSRTKWYAILPTYSCRHAILTCLPWWRVVPSWYCKLFFVRWRLVSFWSGDQSTHDVTRAVTKYIGSLWPTVFGMPFAAEAEDVVGRKPGYCHTCYCSANFWCWSGVQVLLLITQVGDGEAQTDGSFKRINCPVVFLPNEVRTV